MPTRPDPLLSSVFRIAALLSALACLPAASAAQEPSPTPTQPPASDIIAEVGSLMTIGSPQEDRLRIDQLLGRADTDGFLIRSASTLNPVERDGIPRVQGFLAGFHTAWNSGLPFSQNDGAMWAGRGMNWMISGGVRLDWGRVSLLVVPEVGYQQNKEFQTILFNRSRDADRNRFSNPWYDRPESIDMPSRFGSGSFVTAGLGQSSLTVDAGPVAVGAATENLWWGPGIRNAIIMSNHAAGIPHLFLRTARPLETPIGDFEGRWMLGRLAESEYFDNFRGNNVRSLSAIALAYRPWFEPNLSLGFARSVYAAANDGSISPVAAFDAFRSVGRPNERPADDLLREPGADQLFSLFGRWVFPAAGLEAYAEWARYQQPASLRELLVIPHHTQGYTLGAQWALELENDAVARLQGELTFLEPSSDTGERREIGWYTSRPVRQGYTHKGQVIGAAIGPGSSSQWLAADFLPASRWQIGAFAGRIRWDNYAFYFNSGFSPFFAHDVSLYGGLRGGCRIGDFEISAEIATESRMNYLYQSPNPDWEAQDAVDLRNHSFRLSVTPLRR